MLSWLFPTCPVSPWEKAWIEYRLAWLIEKLGKAQLLATHVVLPTDDFFPETYRGTLADAQRLLTQLARHMQLDPARVTLETRPDDSMPDAAGHYDRTDPSRRPVIRVAESQLADPESLISTLAHELAHENLLGGELLTGDDWDHEWVTDLLPVFYGLGIFAANSTIREENFSTGNYSWWSLRQHGYLPSHMLGYAMAVFAFARDNCRTPWKHLLRLDARSALSAGLNYLTRTGDCLLDPRRLADRYELSTSDIHDALQRGSPSRRIIALWEVEAGDREAIPLVQSLLTHRQRDIRWTAVRELSRFGDAALPAIPQIAVALHDRDERIRVAAAQTLGTLKLEPQLVAPELCVNLEDDDEEVVEAAAHALAEFGSAAAVGEKRMLAALHKALIDCSHRVEQAVIVALRQAVADPGQSINDYFHEHDPELRPMAIDALYNDDACTS